MIWIAHQKYHFIIICTREAGVHTLFVTVYEYRKKHAVDKRERAFIGL